MKNSEFQQLDIGSYRLTPDVIGRSSEPNSYIAIGSGDKLLYQRSNNVFSTFNLCDFSSDLRINGCVDVTDKTGIIYNCIDIDPKYAVNNNGSWSEYRFGDSDYIGSAVKYKGDYYMFVTYWGDSNSTISFLKHVDGSSWTTIWSEQHPSGHFYRSCVYNDVIYVFYNDKYASYLYEFDESGIIWTINVNSVFPRTVWERTYVNLFVMHDGLYVAYYRDDNRMLHIGKVVNNIPQSIATKRLGGDCLLYNFSANDKYIVCAMRDGFEGKLLYYLVSSGGLHVISTPFIPYRLNVGNDFTIIGDNCGRYYYTEMFSD